MITLQPNTANQDFVVTLQEAKAWLDDVVEYLMLIRMQDSEVEQVVIPVVQIDNGRYTKLRISTDADDPASGSILLTQTGRYEYFVYGSTVAGNLSTTTNVAGIMEIGMAEVVSSSQVAFPTMTIPDRIVYQ